MFADGNYTTTLPLADLREAKAWIAHTYGDAPLPAEHGGPARMVVLEIDGWPRHRAGQHVACA